MLPYDPSIFGDQRKTDEPFECSRCARRGVGRVQQDQVKPLSRGQRHSAQCSGETPTDHESAGSECAPFQILPDRLRACSVGINENGPPSAPTQSFDSKGSAARIQIQDPAISNLRSQDIEQGFSHGLPGRPHPRNPGNSQTPSPCSPAGDTQVSP